MNEIDVVKAFRGDEADVPEGLRERVLAAGHVELAERRASASKEVSSKRSGQHRKRVLVGSLAGLAVLAAGAGILGIRSHRTSRPTDALQGLKVIETAYHKALVGSTYRYTMGETIDGGAVISEDTNSSGFVVAPRSPKDAPAAESSTTVTGNGRSLTLNELVVNKVLYFGVTGATLPGLPADKRYVGVNLSQVGGQGLPESKNPVSSGPLAFLAHPPAGTTVTGQRDTTYDRAPVKEYFVNLDLASLLRQEGVAKAEQSLPILREGLHYLPTFAPLAIWINGAGELVHMSFTLELNVQGQPIYATFVMSFSDYGAKLEVIPPRRSQVAFETPAQFQKTLQFGTNQ
jgi:hypothetical protein